MPPPLDLRRVVTMAKLQNAYSKGGNVDHNFLERYNSGTRNEEGLLSNSSNKASLVTTERNEEELSPPVANIKTKSKHLGKPKLSIPKGQLILQKAAAKPISSVRHNSASRSTKQLLSELRQKKQIPGHS